MTRARRPSFAFVSVLCACVRVLRLEGGRNKEGKRERRLRRGSSSFLGLLSGGADDDSSNFECVIAAYDATIPPIRHRFISYILDDRSNASEVKIGSETGAKTVGSGAGRSVTQLFTFIRFRASRHLFLIIIIISSARSKTLILTAMRCIRDIDANLM